MQVVVQQASAGVWGEVPEVLTVDSARTIAKTMPANGTALLTIPTGTQTVSRVLASADATLSAGSNSNTNYGSDAAIKVGTTAGSAQEGTSVGLLEFVLPASLAGLTNAVLQLQVTGTAGGTTGVSKDVVMSVLVAADSSWTEAAATWAGTAALGALSSPKTIANTTDNFINWGGISAVAGHVTVPVGSGAAVKMLDITDVVTAAGPGSTLSLLLYRPFRNVAYPTAGGGAFPIAADDLSGGCVVSFASRDSAESPYKWPQLVLYSSS